MNTVKILKTTISETTLIEVSKILNNENSLKVAICNTNTVVRSYKDNELCNTINSFHIKTPDGFPIAKSSSILYKNSQRRVDGYNLFLSTISEGLDKNTSHYFFGSKQGVLNKLEAQLKEMFPDNTKEGFKTEVTALVWEEKDKFNSLMEKSSNDMIELASIIENSDNIKGSLGKLMWSNCKACHSKYRLPH